MGAKHLLNGGGPFVRDRGVKPPARPDILSNEVVAQIAKILHATLERLRRVIKILVVEANCCSKGRLGNTPDFDRSRVSSGGLAALKGSAASQAKLVPGVARGMV